jgi:type IV pilus assembly protein PilA
LLTIFVGFLPVPAEIHPLLSHPEGRASYLSDSSVVQSLPGYGEQAASGCRCADEKAGGCKQAAAWKMTPQSEWKEPGRKGFSLIELLIVIAIILIIAAIAIPNLLRARISANEASAVASMRSITAAETAYYTAFSQVGYAAQLQHLGRTAPCVPAPTQACLLDNNLANAVPGSNGHSGYQFLATGVNSGGPLNASFVAGGTPITANKTGTRDFCVVTDGILRSNPTAGGMPPVTIPPCIAYAVVL